jgi:hypothetical protein
VVYVNTSNLNYFPGTVAGTVTSNSTYDGFLNAYSKSGGSVGFFGVTPAARPSVYTQTYTTAYKSVPNMTYVAPSGGSTVDTQCRASLVQLAADMLAYLKVITAILDDLQSVGLLQ